jgi:multidrug efflux pump subunit AcrA (membrane-fusion protein)
MRRRWRTRIVLGALCLGLVGLAYRYLPKSLQSAPGPQAATVTKGDLVQRVTVAGVIVPKRRTVILPPYPGFIQKVFVKVGDKVKQGDPVLSIVQSLTTREEVFPIRAPFPGVVVQVLGSEGEYVKDGDLKKFIVRIDDLSELYVQADVPELDMVKIRKGQEAVVKASAILDRSYKGVIEEIALSAKERDEWGWGGKGQVEYAVRISLKDPDERVRPGMSAILDIITDRRDGVLSLRHEFLRKDGDKHIVEIEGKGPTEVGVGLHNEEAYEITSGLKEGERVLPTDFGNIPGDRG